MVSFFINRKKEIFSGLIFVIIFYLLGYMLLNSQDFFARDDGIITMSHAKNLVDYGFIGVNPSGERVLGYSSPLQFIIFTVVYFIFRLNPFTYTITQTIICTFFLGYIFGKFFKETKLSIIYSIVCAFSLTRIYTFLGWHASGMENALVHVFFIGVVYILYFFVKSNKINYFFSIVVFFAAIARFDSVYHITPLLVIFTVYWFVSKKNLEALKFSLLVGAFWVLFMLSNYLYFGSFFPHTAAAQNIHITENILNLLSLNRSYFFSTWDVSSLIIKRSGILLLPIYSILTVLSDKKPINEDLKFTYVVCFSLIITGIFNPFIFGKTRIDYARTVTFLSPIILLFVCLGIKEIKFKKTLPHICIFPILICAVMGIYSVFSPPRYLGYSTSGFMRTSGVFFSAAEENNIHRATVSNPDLGIVSWNKQYNIIDLGKIGSPIMTYIAHDERLIPYYFTYIAPDIIETHGSWSVKYSFLWNSNLFRELYTPLSEITYYKDDPKFPQGFWIRNDIMEASETEERIFYDKLRSDLSLENIEQELISLQDKDNVNSAYISRTVYKFIPELKKTGLFDGTVALFEKYNASEFDKYLLASNKDATAWKPIAEMFNNYEVP